MSPENLTVDDKTGDLYFVDQDSKVIRKITPDGKVFTVFQVSFVKENYLRYPQIKDNYLYFIYNNRIKRLDLSKKDAKYEDYLNPNSKTSLYSFHFLSDGTMLLHEERNLRIVNLETKEIKPIIYTSKRDEAFRSTAEGTVIAEINVKENPKTKEIFFGRDNLSIYKLTKNNEIVLFSENSDLNPISGFDFDKDGNIYTISINRRKLIRVSLSGEIKDISDLKGVVDFDELYFRMLSTSISIDRKKNILYLSYIVKNQIFKIDLNKGKK
jgi:sugar lactone lactonase YvrE